MDRAIPVRIHHAGRVFLTYGRDLGLYLREAPRTEEERARRECHVHEFPVPDGTNGWMMRVYQLDRDEPDAQRAYEKVKGLVGRTAAGEMPDGLPIGPVRVVHLLEATPGSPLVGLRSARSYDSRNEVAARARELCESWLRPVEPTPALAFAGEGEAGERPPAPGDDDPNGDDGFDPGGEPGAAERGAEIAPLRAAAERGDAEAQLAYGMKLLEGDGVAKNLEEGAALIVEAAEAGHPRAQREAGWIHQQGLGVSERPSAALLWYLRAADNGNAQAMNDLGVLHARGYGVERDDVAARQLFRRAAEAGDANALRNMGVFLRFGRGGEKDLAQAVTWLRRAVDADLDTGLWSLGHLYHDHPEIAPEGESGLDLIRRAARRGVEQAREFLEERDLDW